MERLNEAIRFTDILLALRRQLQVVQHHARNGNLLTMSAELTAPLSQSAFAGILYRQVRPINQDQGLGLCIRCSAQAL
jgi:hypothetical protein